VNGREPLEPLRVWVGGFSGGAKAASLAAAVHPYAFAGALLVGGAGYWRPLAVPEDSRVLAPECAPPPYQVPQRFALVVGEADEWRNPVRAIAKALDEDGYHAATFEARGLGHELPVKGVLELALTHLDGGPCIHCPKCGLVSFNSNDVALRYCGNCHATHEALTHG
jgi:pimeloyl-ACP methyl ester carboxylesterase